MLEEKRYKYLGINGILDTSVCLEDVPCTAYIRLIADEKCILTNGKIQKYWVDIFDGEDKEAWTEIPVGQE